ncbi:MAG TPA: SDR family oxidoreductase [Methylomirabilota bacterium]|jgi:NAD(P)-dependent dehydrogenase (short-subunit alcohol dehydrogenase family)|nr:SDR family oxidoreductase [Methylomirabilota bacterium]
MDLGLRGKVAIVTGGSDGLGLATAGRLAAEGAAVAICARDEGRLKAAADKLRATGAAALDVPADVTQPGDLERLVSRTLHDFGRIDILVNNAGTSDARGFETVDDAAWQADLELKLFAAVRSVRLCVPHMRRAGGGRIVNILNTGAKAPAARSVPTSVSRAAGLALTKVLSKELAPERILVNAVLIGLVKSGQWERRWAGQEGRGTLEAFYEHLARERGVPIGRVAEAEELGALVAFLVSAQAAYITGVAINFDGGLSPVV